MRNIEVSTPIDFSDAPECSLCGANSYKKIKLFTYKGEKIELNLCAVCCRELVNWIS